MKIMQEVPVPYNIDSNLLPDMCFPTEGTHFTSFVGNMMGVISKMYIYIQRLEHTVAIYSISI